MGSQYSQEPEKPKENLKELFDLRKKKIRNASPFIERTLTYNPIEKKVSKEETKLTLKELNLDKKFVEKYYNEEITQKLIKPDFVIVSITESGLFSVITLAKASYPLTEIASSIDSALILPQFLRAVRVCLA